MELRDLDDALMARVRALVAEVDRRGPLVSEARRELYRVERDLMNATLAVLALRDKEPRVESDDYHHVIHRARNLNDNEEVPLVLDD